MNLSNFEEYKRKKIIFHLTLFKIFFFPLNASTSPILTYDIQLNDQVDTERNSSSKTFRIE